MFAFCATQENILANDSLSAGVFVWQCRLTGAPVALGGEGGPPRGEGVTRGRVHHAGVEGGVRVGPGGENNRRCEETSDFILHRVEGQKTDDRTEDIGRSFVLTTKNTKENSQKPPGTTENDRPTSLMLKHSKHVD